MARTTAVMMFAIFSVAAPATASTSRVLALGGDGDFVEDPVGVLRWYGSLGDHRDLATLEFGDLLDDGEAPGNVHGLPGHGGGAHFGLDDAGRWGTAGFYLEDDLPGETPGGAFTALWSRRWGAAEVGLHARMTTFGEALAATAAGDHGDSRYDHHYGLGLRWHLGDGQAADLAGEVINHRTESQDALHHLLPRDDWSSFGVRARAFLKVSEKATVVPVIDHRVDRTAVYSNDIAGPADREAAATRLGVGLQLRTAADRLILLSAEYRGGHEDHELLVDESLDAAWSASRREFFQIRGRLGLEAPVLPWLIARAALQYVRVDEEIRRHGADAHEDLDREDVATPVCAGLGARWGAFTVDVVYNDTAPVSPGLAVSGLLTDGRDGFTSLSLGYSF